MEESQLQPQPVFAFAERGDPTTDGRHMLAEVEIEAVAQFLAVCSGLKLNRELRISDPVLT